MLRKAEINDLEAVFNIKSQVLPLMLENNNQQWSENYPTRDDFKKDIKEGHLFVYEIEGEIAGFLVADQERPREYEEVTWSVDPKHAAVLHRTAISPKFQGQGIFKLMLDEINNILHDIGYKAIHTDTGKENIPMRKQFEKHGFNDNGDIVLNNSGAELHVTYEKVI